MTRHINAFPEYYNEAHGSDETYPGMELRDYFAGQALAGFAVEGGSYESLAVSAYRMADAMMAEREKAK